jgi:ABC-type oligopeptide transport system substrate-binding subunit
MENAKDLSPKKGNVTQHFLRVHKKIFGSASNEASNAFQGCTEEEDCLDKKLSF